MSGPGAPRSIDQQPRLSYQSGWHDGSGWSGERLRSRPVTSRHGLGCDGARSAPGGGSKDLAVFCSQVFQSLRRSDQRRWAEFYINGLMSTPGRKTVTRIVQTLAAPPADQSVQQFVNQSPWNWQVVRHDLAALLEDVLEPVAWAVLPVHFPKSGEHSVAVTRQFVPHVGRTVNCQLAMSLWIIGRRGACPVDWRLVLPRRWADDPRRRKRAGVPPELAAEEPWDCAVELVLQWARRAGGIQRPVLLDLRGGQPGAALDRLVERDVPFVAQVSRTTPLRPAAGLAPAAGADRRDVRIAADLVRSAVRRPIGSPRLAGSPLAVLPVGSLTEDRRPAPAERPLLLLADSDGSVPCYYVTNLARSCIDRGLLQPLQQGRLAESQLQELGLADFEGRSFRGWHHHVTLVSAARAFQLWRRAKVRRQAPTVHRPLGSRAGRPELALAGDPAPARSSGAPAWLAQRGTVRELCHGEELRPDDDVQLALLIEGRLVTTRSASDRDEAAGSGPAPTDAADGSRSGRDGAAELPSGSGRGDLPAERTGHRRSTTRPDTPRLVALTRSPDEPTITRAVGRTRMVVYDRRDSAEIVARMARLATMCPVTSRTGQQPVAAVAVAPEPADPGEHRLAAMVRSAEVLRTALRRLEDAIRSAARDPLALRANDHATVEATPALPPGHGPDDHDRPDDPDGREEVRVQPDDAGEEPDEADLAAWLHTHGIPAADRVARVLRTDGLDARVLEEPTG